MFMVAILAGLLALGLMLAILAQRKPRTLDYDRLFALAEQNEINSRTGLIREIDWGEVSAPLSRLEDRIGQAGFISPEDRRVAALIRATILAISALVLAAIGFNKSGAAGLTIGFSIGIYLGYLGWLYFIRYRRNDFHREVQFQLPLTLESIILLVESGLGVLPAIERVVKAGDNLNTKNPVLRLLGLVYDLAAHGIPLGRALEMVADACDIKVVRHVLLHLDLSASEGGELIPSLRSLSHHAHTEWKLSVESRVKRLENLVVFPVFVSVIGLMFVTAAVPMVPVLKLRETMKAKSGVTTIGAAEQEEVAR